MPFLNDEELEELNEKIHTAEEEQEAIVYSHKRALEDAKETTQKFKIATIILGIVALLGVAGTIYFMSFSTPVGMISVKKANKQQEELKQQIASMEETIQGMSETPDDNASAADKESLDGEVVYAVQIGAFEKKDLSMYSDKFVNFREIKSGGYNKYALGNFATLNEAKKFRRELVKLGFKNSFIASYQNDKRIKIEEAW